MRIYTRLIDFLWFATKAIRELDGTVVSKDKYLEYLATVLVAFADGSIKRLIINLPPRHLKTLLATVSLAAWILAHQPNAKILVVACSRDLAERMSRLIRKILLADWYKRAFSTRILKGHSKATNFSTTDGGEVYATSFESALTGFGGDFIIIDDPHHITDARDAKQLARTIETYNTEVVSRLDTSSEGGIMVVGHRIHDENDLSAHLLRTGRWTHVVLPLIATQDQTYKTAYGPWHRPKDELLRKNSYDEDEIANLRLNSVNPCFDLLYQQDVDGQALPSIKSDHFPLYTPDRVQGLARVISIDPGIDDGDDGSFSVIQVWAPERDNHFLVEQFRERCDFQKLVQKAKHFARTNSGVPILIEDTANGPALISELKRKGRKEIYKIKPHRSKRARFRPHIEKIVAGHVHLPVDGTFCPSFVEELVEFPHGASDDQVDALSQYLTWVEQQDPSKFLNPRMSSQGYVATALNSQPREHLSSSQSPDPKAPGIGVGSGNSNPFFKRFIG